MQEPRSAIVEQHTPASVHGDRAAQTRLPGVCAGLGRALPVLGAAWLSALGGCQSYEPEPLEPELHRAAWHARTLEKDTLARFVERLGRAPVAAPFEPADGLQLAEGQLVALVFNPGLRLERLRAGLAEASAEYAGLWTDPKLQLSVLRITEGIPNPWVITPALTFSLPVSGRLAAQRSLADADLSAARRRVLEAEWSVWFQVREAWVEWSASLLRVEETERLVEAMGPLVETAQQLARAGELARTEANLFAIERAQLANRLGRLRGEAQAAQERLRILLGLSPEAPVVLEPSLVVDSSAPGQAGGETVARSAAASDLGERNLTLARLEGEYDAAEERLRLEIRKQMPDITLGPMYETDAGRPSVGLFGGIPIPLWNANRRGIAEARAEREIARAAFETQYEILIGRWTQAHALADALGGQRADLEQSLVPLVDRQLADALRLMQLGEESSLVLLQSLSRSYATKLELIQARSGEAIARAQLEYLTGPPLTWRAAAGEAAQPGPNDAQEAPDARRGPSPGKETR